MSMFSFRSKVTVIHGFLMWILEQVITNRNIPDVSHLNFKNLTNFTGDNNCIMVYEDNK